MACRQALLNIALARPTALPTAVSQCNSFASPTRSRPMRALGLHTCFYAGQMFCQMLPDSCAISCRRSDRPIKNTAHAVSRQELCFEMMPRVYCAPELHKGQSDPHNLFKSPVFQWHSPQFGLVCTREHQLSHGYRFAGSNPSIGKASSKHFCARFSIGGRARNRGQSSCRRARRSTH